MDTNMAMILILILTVISLTLSVVDLIQSSKKNDKYISRKDLQKVLDYFNGQMREIDKKLNNVRGEAGNAELNIANLRDEVKLLNTRLNQFAPPLESGKDYKSITVLDGKFN